MKLLAVVGLALVVAACSSGTPESSAPAGAGTAATPAPAASTPPAAAGPRVFFAEPQDGATVKSPVKLRFAVENFQISPVPEGTVTTARSGLGHHHVGVDTDCLPPGTVIPKAAPWVHFGKGDAEMDMQLTPGTHKLVLEIGDDTHTTLPGLCSTITITVVQ
jgi:hypothetical protein